MLERKVTHTHTHTLMQSVMEEDGCTLFIDHHDSDKQAISESVRHTHAHTHTHTQRTHSPPTLSRSNQERDRKSTRLNSSHKQRARMPSSS